MEYSKDNFQHVLQNIVQHSTFSIKRSQSFIYFSYDTEWTELPWGVINDDCIYSPYAN